MSKGDISSLDGDLYLRYFIGFPYKYVVCWHIDFTLYNMC